MGNTLFLSVITLLTVTGWILLRDLYVTAGCRLLGAITANGHGGHPVCNDCSHPFRVDVG